MTVCRMTQSKVKVENWKCFHFQKLCVRHLQWELATDPLFVNKGTISKFDRAGLLIFVPVFVSHDFELGRNVSLKSQPSIPHKDNLLLACLHRM